MIQRINLTGRIYFCSRQYQLNKLLDAGHETIGMMQNHNNPLRTIYVFRISDALIDTLNSIDSEKKYIWTK